MTNITGTRSEKRTHYFSVSKGWLIRRVQTPTETSITRKITMGERMGQEIHEEFSNQFEGKLIDVKVKEAQGNFQKKLQLSFIHESGEVAVIELNLYSGYSCGVLNKLSNCNTAQNILLETWDIKDDKKEGGHSYHITLKQGGQKLADLFTKESAELPQWEKITFQGKTVWDQSKQVDFLLHNLLSTKSFAKVAAPAVAPLISEDVIDENEGPAEVPAPKTVDEAFKNVISGKDGNAATSKKKVSF